MTYYEVGTTCGSAPKKLIGGISCFPTSNVLEIGPIIQRVNDDSQLKYDLSKCSRVRSTPVPCRLLLRTETLRVPERTGLRLHCRNSAADVPGERMHNYRMTSFQEV